jgi:hypothetical protein
MRVSNKGDEKAEAGSPFAELFQLQSEFQARLAEEALRYLRRLQGTLGPAAPGTIVLPQPDLELTASAAPGGSVELSLEIENLQRVHCFVTPQLSPLVSADGTTWFPGAEPAAAPLLVAPGQVQPVRIVVSAPAALPAGTYRGALLLPGFRAGALPVALRIGAVRRKPATGGAPRRRPRRRA